MSESERRADHIYHTWINKRQDERREKGMEWEHSLYAFKDLIGFLKYGHNQIEKAYTGQLPVVHQQCSMSAPEPIQSNNLRCCLGEDVTKCEILLSLKAKFDEERNRECGVLGKCYEQVPVEQVYRLMAQTCAWHIFMTQVDGKEGFRVDASEGHLMDESDRMFWRNVYRSLAAVDDAE